MIMFRTILLATILATTVQVAQADHKKSAVDAMVAPTEPVTVVPMPLVEAPKQSKKSKKQEDFPSSSPSGSTFPSVSPSLTPSSVPSATPSSVPSDVPSKGAKSKKGGKAKNAPIVPEAAVRRTKGLRST